MDFQNTRRKRVFLPLLPAEFHQLQRYAARVGLPMSRVLLELARESITEIAAGGDPLGKSADSAAEPGC